MDALAWIALLVPLVLFEAARLALSAKARRQYVVAAYRAWDAACNGDRRILERSAWLPHPTALRWVAVFWFGSCVLAGVVLAPWLLLLGAGFAALAYLLDVLLHRAAQVVLRKGEMHR